MLIHICFVWQLGWGLIDFGGRNGMVKGIRVSYFMAVALCSQLSGDPKPGCSGFQLYNIEFSTKEECVANRTVYFNSVMESTYSDAIRQDRKIVMVKPRAVCLTQQEAEMFIQKYGTNSVL